VKGEAIKLPAGYGLSLHKKERGGGSLREKKGGGGLPTKGVCEVAGLSKGGNQGRHHVNFDRVLTPKLGFDGM